MDYFVTSLTILQSTCKLKTEPSLATSYAFTKFVWVNVPSSQVQPTPTPAIYHPVTCGTRQYPKQPKHSPKRAKKLTWNPYTWICERPRCLEKFLKNNIPNGFLNDGDESHGIESVKNHAQKTIDPSILHRITLPESNSRSRLKIGLLPQTETIFQSSHFFGAVIICHLKRDHPKRKGSSSKHPFLRQNSLVLGRFFTRIFMVTVFFSTSLAFFSIFKEATVVPGLGAWQPPKKQVSSGSTEIWSTKQQETPSSPIFPVGISNNGNKNTKKYYWQYLYTSTLKGVPNGSVTGCQFTIP